MIHSFLKHGAGPAARPSIGDTKMPKNGTRSSSRRPPPCARLTLWLLPAVPPTTPERPSTDSSPLSGGTCGANTGLGEGEAKPGGSSGPSRRMRCRGKGAGRTRRVRGGRPGPRGETARPLPQARARWAARRRCTRQRVRPRSRPPGPSRRSSRSLVCSRRGALPGRAGSSAPPPGAVRVLEPRPPLAPPSRPLPGAAARGGVAEPEEAGRGEGRGGGAGGGGEEPRGPSASCTARSLLAKAPLSRLVVLLPELQEPPACVHGHRASPPFCLHRSHIPLPPRVERWALA